MKAYRRTDCREVQPSGGVPAHFPCLKDVIANAVDADITLYKDKYTRLLREFEQRCLVFDELETDFRLGSLFIVNASDTPADIQVGQLTCNGIQILFLKNEFASAGLDISDQHLLPRLPKLTTLAGNVLCFCGTAYLCEQVVSVMGINNNKSKTHIPYKAVK